MGIPRPQGGVSHTVQFQSLTIRPRRPEKFSCGGGTWRTGLPWRRDIEEDSQLSSVQPVHSLNRSSAPSLGQFSAQWPVLPHLKQVPGGGHWCPISLGGGLGAATRSWYFCLSQEAFFILACFSLSINTLNGKFSRFLWQVWGPPSSTWFWLLC